MCPIVLSIGSSHTGFMTWMFSLPVDGLNEKHAFGLHK